MATSKKAPEHIKDLVPDPSNRRKHNPRNVGMIVDSLQRVGAGRSIVIDETNEVLAGNGVLEAAGEAGITKVLTVDADGETIIAVRRNNLTPDQKRALALYDNRAAELAEWDTDQLKADVEAGEDLSAFFHDDELAELLDIDEPKDGKTDPDAVPEPRATDIQAGDLFELGDHRLLCGDSTKAEDVARVMNGAKADMVFTDPPYALFGNSTGVSGITDDKMVRPFFRDVFAASRTHTKLFGHVYVCCDWHSAFAIQIVSQELGLAAKNLIVWDKGDGGVGSMYQHCHEFVWFFSNTPRKATVVGNAKAGERQVNGVGNIWRVSRTLANNKEHGAQKPVELVVVAVQAGADIGECVADWFCGSGTTIIAAEQLGRKCYAIEIEPTYCQVTIDRWEAFTGQKAVKVG